jgi:hypothetical protein
MGSQRAVLSSLTLLLNCFALHYRVIPEHGYQLVRRSEGAFAHMWRYDRLNRFKLFGGIATCIDFCARQGGMSRFDMLLDGTAPPSGPPAPRRAEVQAAQRVHRPSLIWFAPVRDGPPSRDYRSG